MLKHTTEGANARQCRRKAPIVVANFPATSERVRPAARVLAPTLTRRMRDDAMLSQIAPRIARAVPGIDVVDPEVTAAFRNKESRNHKRNPIDTIGRRVLR